MRSDVCVWGGVSQSAAASSAPNSACAYCASIHCSAATQLPLCRGYIWQQPACSRPNVGCFKFNCLPAPEVACRCAPRTASPPLHNFKQAPLDHSASHRSTHLSPHGCIQADSLCASCCCLCQHMTRLLGTAAGCCCCCCCTDAAEQIKGSICRQTERDCCCCC